MPAPLARFSCLAFEVSCKQHEGMLHNSDSFLGVQCAHRVHTHWFWLCAVQPLDQEDKPKVACEFVTQVS